MRTMRDIIVGVDMGGTSLRALVVSGRNKILAAENVRTNRSQTPSALIADIAALVEGAAYAAGLRRSDLRAASIGAPGAVDRRGVVNKAPNLGWKEVPLGPKLKALL